MVNLLLAAIHGTTLQLIYNNYVIVSINVADLITILNPTYHHRSSLLHHGNKKSYHIHRLAQSIYSLPELAYDNITIFSYTCSFTYVKLSALTNTANTSSSCLRCTFNAIKSHPNNKTVNKHDVSWYSLVSTYALMILKLQKLNWMLVS